MANQGKVVLGGESALASGGAAANNVATNQAADASNKVASNLTGKTIYPERVCASDLQLKTTLTVGSQVQLTDGCVRAVNLASDSVTTDKIASGSVTANEVSVSTLSSMSANLGSVNAGSLAIGSGEVSIGSGSSGIGISNNVFTMVTGGVTKISLNGNTGTAYFAGEIVASKVTVTANAANTVNFGADVTIGGNLTVGAAATNRYVYLMGTDNYIQSINTGAINIVAASATAVSGGSAEITIGGSPTSFDVTGVADATLNSDCFVVTGESVITKVMTTTLNVSVTGTGAFATGTWTHGWNTGSATVRFFAAAQDFDTTKVTNINSIRVERTSSTTVKVEFRCDTYASTETVTFDVMAVGPA